MQELLLREPLLLVLLLREMATALLLLLLLRVLLLVVHQIDGQLAWKLLLPRVDLLEALNVRVAVALAVAAHGFLVVHLVAQHAQRVGRSGTGGHMSRRVLCVGLCVCLCVGLVLVVLLLLLLQLQILLMGDRAVVVLTGIVVDGRR